MTMRLLANLLLAGSSLGALTPMSPGADGSTREAVLESAHHPWLRWPAFPDHQEEMRALYATEPDGLVWFQDGTIEPSTPSAVEALVRADERGLAPEDYDAPLLAARLRTCAWGPTFRTTAPSSTWPCHWACYVTSATCIKAAWILGPPAFAYEGHADDLDLPTLLRSGRDEGSIADTLDRIEPTYPPYRRLKSALAFWRTLSKGLPLEPAPELKKVEPGDDYEGVPQLAARLRAFGDLPMDSPWPGTATRDPWSWE